MSELHRRAVDEIRAGIRRSDGGAHAFAAEILQEYIQWLLGTSKSGMTRWRIGPGRVVLLVVVPQPESAFIEDEVVGDSQNEALVYARRVGFPFARDATAMMCYQKMKARLRELLGHADPPPELSVIAWHALVAEKARTWVAPRSRGDVFRASELAPRESDDG